MTVRKSSSVDLRRKYAIHLEVSLIAALLMCILAFRAPWRPSDTTLEVTLAEQEVIQLDQVLPTEQQLKQPPPPPAPPVPVEVPNETVLEDEALSFDATLDVSEAVPEVGPPPPPAEPAEEVAEEATEDEIFVIVEQMPELIGGITAIQGALRYPEMARRAGVEGRVIVQFIVDPQGNVREPVVVRGIGAGCDEEAVRAVLQAKFVPGKQRGKPVPVRMSVPVTFKLRVS